MPRAIASAPRDWPSRVVILEGERSFPHGNSVPFDLVCKHLPWRSSHPTGLGLPPRASPARLEGLGAREKQRLISMEKPARNLNRRFHSGFDTQFLMLVGFLMLLLFS